MGSKHGINRSDLLVPIKRGLPHVTAGSDSTHLVAEGLFVVMDLEEIDFQHRPEKAPWTVHAAGNSDSLSAVST